MNEEKKYPRIIKQDQAENNIVMLWGVEYNKPQVQNYYELQEIFVY